VHQLTHPLSKISGYATERYRLSENSIVRIIALKRWATFRAYRVNLKLIYTTTPDKTRPSRLPVDRRRDAGQTSSYA